MQVRHGVVMIALAAVAAVPAAAVARTAVTVYTNDLGFVREERTIELGGSRDTVRLADVPDRIDVPSVRLVPETGRVTRLAYRFDVGSGDGLLETARGGRVRVTLRENRVVEGTLVASDGAWIVVREEDGTVHSLSRTSVDDVRMSVRAGGLVTRPMLEAAIEGARRGRIGAELTYLTGGMTWSAEHTLVRRGETSATWSSAVTVENTTGRDFDAVTLSLVAGDPRRISPMPPPMPMYQRTMAVANEKAADLSEQTFAEYHLYSLDRPATLRNRETQKLTMYDTRDIKVTPRYRYKSAEGGGVRAQLELQNARDNDLGVPLPAGRVRVYEPDPQGELHFTGESSIKHTPQGEKVTVEVGQAFDLVAERRETTSRRISDREREYGVEIKLRNRKTNAVTIDVEEIVSGDFEVTQKSQAFERKDANTIVFSVPVAAGKEAVVTYTVRVRY